MGKPLNVSVFESPEQVANAAAELFVECAATSIAARGRFAVALAGGSTPRRAYELLASDSFAKRVEWRQVHLFFGDERTVPPDSVDSNYRMVHDSLNSLPANVHRMRGEIPPAESAASYEEELREFFGAVTWPRFDLVFLGLGQDGHTASLFPGSPALHEDKRWVVETEQPQSKQKRLTLTLPVLNRSAQTVFMVTGKEKAAILARVLARETAADELPAQKILPVNGKLEWLIDRAAADAG